MGDAGTDDGPAPTDATAPSDEPAAALSCAGKLARLVLENRGPLSSSELAGEAGLDPGRAASALEELAAASLARPVCGVRDSREELYALTASVDDADADDGADDDADGERPNGAGSDGV